MGTKKKLLILMFVALATVQGFAQQDTTTKSQQDMDRIELCKENFRKLFQSEALNGQGNDPEMMDILQKYIFGEVFHTGDIDIKTRELITCVSLVAMQQLPQFKSHAIATLNVAVTPVELREAIYQCAPIIGFPKVLNTLSVLNEVFAERGIKLPLENQSTVTEENRYKKGEAIQSLLNGDQMKDTTSCVPSNINKDVARFLTEVNYGDFYTRNGLDIETRELLAYCVLVVIGAEDQLKCQIYTNTKIGNSRETLTSATIQCMPYIGFPAALKALKIIEGTLVQ